ncbi:hypothetical protein MQC88_02645 [Luteimonas sp. 50]|uniref:Uncharacterized protein n=1 Tax=Cognatiluteimonas sedimenti TaxID=2927791 RepID=A0ABT0A1J6_9GAMM|nr:hypothetical protein [Lysobacter sedimenti]MCJ0824865.1 hypothetical protein [Lysobacter sedimenti]
MNTGRRVFLHKPIVAQNELPRSSRQQMPSHNRLLDALDLHVIGIAVIPLLLAALLPFPWVPWLVAILPLGRLATRASDCGVRGGHRCRTCWSTVWW